MYAQLLIDLFKFLTPFLRNAELTKATHLLYKVSHSQKSPDTRFLSDCKHYWCLEQKPVLYFMVCL